MNYRYFDDTNRVYVREFSDGTMESGLVSSLPEGTKIAPADELPVEVRALTLEDITKALKKKGVLLDSDLISAGKEYELSQR